MEIKLLIGVLPIDECPAQQSEVEDSLAAAAQDGNLAVVIHEVGGRPRGQMAMRSRTRSSWVEMTLGMSPNAESARPGQ